MDREGPGSPEVLDDPGVVTEDAEVPDVPEVTQDAVEGPVVLVDVEAAFGDGFDESAAAATVGVAVIVVVLGLVEADDDDGAVDCSLSDGISSSSRV